MDEPSPLLPFVETLASLDEHGEIGLDDDSRAQLQLRVGEPVGALLGSVAPDTEGRMAHATGGGASAAGEIS